MNADEDVPAASISPVGEHLRERGRDAILVDATLAPQVDADWFELDHWRRHGVLQMQLGGRGSVAVVDTPAGECVLRHYRRGGAVASLMGDRYLWTGASRTRCFAEFRLLQRIAAKGLPGPVAVGARYQRSGLFYTADLLTRRIAHAVTLAERIAASSLSRDDAIETGALIARFHREGFWHADLNAHNILLAPAGLYLIDFDRGRERAEATSWRIGNLQRLRRSLIKVGAASTGLPQFDETIWAPLQRGYEETFGA